MDPKKTYLYTVRVKREHIKTLGDLRNSSYITRSVKDEMRHNVLANILKCKSMFEGILGYDQTVIPQLQNAIISRHSILLLGLRGQAKSRILRQLPELLDEYIPVISGSELHDNPFAPLSKFGRDLVRTHEDETPITWLHRSERYAEKLATPDTSIADLIGDIDPIKAAQNRLTYADEDVIHFGIIPRTNRGIFALNELPDLQARLQVGLLNLMEEQDIQIRGFNVRFPLDIMMVFSANPEDYTNRGNIITPLKDRIDSQILTHYPRSIKTALEITKQEAWQKRGHMRVAIPQFIREIVEILALEARDSEYVDQKSGVSARMTRSALELLVGNAERRAQDCGEIRVCIRVSDLYSIEPAITGKLELVYEGELEGPQKVARLLIGRAIRKVFAMYFPDPSSKGKERETYSKLLSWFAQGNTIKLEPGLSDPELKTRLRSVPGLHEIIKQQFGTNKPPTNQMDSWILKEFILEGLHQSSMLGKEEDTYSDMMGSMLGEFSPDEDDYE